MKLMKLLRKQSREMMIKKISAYTLLIFVLAVAISGCASEINDKEALVIAQQFVNDNVKFYVNQNHTQTEDIEVVEKASIDIVKIAKNQNTHTWDISVIVSSNATGELKKVGMVIPVDAKTKSVKKEMLKSFKP